MPNRAYRVGLDCRLAGQRHAGIGRYTENLVRELLKLPNQFDWIFFFNDLEQAQQVLGDTPVDSVKVVLTSARHYSLSEQTELPKLFAAQNLNLLHVPHFNVPLFYDGKLVVTIHDLLWHEYRGAAVTTLPMWQYWPKYLMYRLTVNSAVHKAEQIIVPAQRVANQVLQYYPDLQSKLHVIPEGVEERFFKKSASTKGSIKENPYFVYLGSLYPHKNVKVVIDALKKLPNYSLKVVSSRSVFQDQVKAYVRDQALSDRVEFLGYQSDDDVTQLLHGAAALVQPSLSEGFGLTGLEAMAAGTPVLASDIPIFKEVYQDQAILFEPQSVDAFLNAVKKLEQLNREHYAKTASEFAHHYQWSKMAKETLAVYNASLNTEPA